jgi:hypothetical protein
MKRLEKGRLLASCLLLLLARRSLASYWKLVAFVSLSCISGSTLTTTTTHEKTTVRGTTTSIKCAISKPWTPSSLHSAANLFGFSGEIK